MRTLFFLALFLSGCTSPAFRYAQAKHPGCDVTQLDENRDSVQVVVKCPGSDPFEQTFRKR